jgi:Protein of unknown function (DUF2480)
MSEEIITNKIKESGLIQLDLESYMPHYEIATIDIKDLLFQELILKEKDFRLWAKGHDWKQYKNKGVIICNSADAIIPTWAFMLITSALTNIALKTCVGDATLLHQLILSDVINDINIDELAEKRVIVKGCAKLPSPELALSLLVQKIQPHVKSLMFGEPCSTVPIYKK